MVESKTGPTGQTFLKMTWEGHTLAYLYRPALHDWVEFYELWNAEEWENLSNTRLGSEFAADGPLLLAALRTELRRGTIKLSRFVKASDGRIRHFELDMTGVTIKELPSSDDDRDPPETLKVGPFTLPKTLIWEGLPREGTELPPPKPPRTKAGVIRVRPRDVALEALQFELGWTSRSEILDFCPVADIGVVAKSDGEIDPDSVNIKWVCIPRPDGSYSGYLQDTDWLLKGVTGRYFVVTDEVFRHDYEVIE